MILLVARYESLFGAALFAKLSKKRENASIDGIHRDYKLNETKGKATDLVIFFSIVLATTPIRASLLSVVANPHLLPQLFLMILVLLIPASSNVFFMYFLLIIQ